MSFLKLRKIKKMFRFIEISLVLVIFFDILNAQIRLNKTNLAAVCVCDPKLSTSIRLLFKNIETIDPDTFTGLTSLQRLVLGSIRTQN